MIIILKDPTASELSLVNQLLDGKVVTALKVDEQKTQQDREWLRPNEFIEELSKKGYKCYTSKTRKSICKRFNIPFRKTGKELWFKNELYRIPVRKPSA